MNAEQVSGLLRSALPGAEVLVRSDDGTHFAARLVSERFAGLGRLKRHQLVYAALGTLVGNEIHALSIEALTPAEAAGGGLG